MLASNSFHPLVFIVNLLCTGVYRCITENVSEIQYVARGGATGVMPPPKLLVNVFFAN